MPELLFWLRLFPLVLSMDSARCHNLGVWSRDICPPRRYPRYSQGIYTNTKGCRCILPQGGTLAGGIYLGLLLQKSWRLFHPSTGVLRPVRWIVELLRGGDNKHDAKLEREHCRDCTIPPTKPGFRNRLLGKARHASHRC